MVTENVTIFATEGANVSRTARLLELLIRVQSKTRFTAQELADEFGVSRRTMLRDLQALSAMGVALHSTPGPGGGYALPWGGRRLSLALTVDEALGLIVSYEAFLRYAESPFTGQNLSAVTKLRAALPPDVVAELDRLRRHLAVLDPVRDFPAPLLGELFQAAVEASHLSVVYDSASGLSERIIFPFGIFASRGFWYCACHDANRAKTVVLRADRFLKIERVGGLERPVHVPLDDWINVTENGAEKMVKLRASVTARAAKSYELASLFGRIETDSSGRGVIDTRIPVSSIDYYAARLLSLGTDVRVESPPALITAMREKIQALAMLYSQTVQRTTPRSCDTVT